MVDRTAISGFGEVPNFVKKVPPAIAGGTFLRAACVGLPPVRRAVKRSKLLCFDNE